MAKEKILPQANTLSTVIKVFIYSSNKLNCTKENIASFCGFDPRQADYYLGACYYLDLVDEDGKATELGKDILKDPSQITERVYQVIISNDFISKIFAHRLFHTHEESKEYGRNLVIETYPQYGVSVRFRRSDAILGWCEEIIDYINLRS